MKKLKSANEKEHMANCTCNILDKIINIHLFVKYIFTISNIRLPTRSIKNGALKAKQKYAIPTANVLNLAVFLKIIIFCMVFVKSLNLPIILN
jgi:hypothetical protein